MTRKAKKGSKNEEFREKNSWKVNKNNKMGEKGR